MVCSRVIWCQSAGDHRSRPPPLRKYQATSSRSPIAISEATSHHSRGALGAAGQSTMVIMTASTMPDITASGVCW